MFKLPLGYSRNRAEELKADTCAESLFDKDPCKFQNSAYKLSSSNPSCHVNSISGVSCPENIANMYRKLTS